MKFKAALQITGKFLLLLAIWVLSLTLTYVGLSDIIERYGKPTSTFIYELIPFLGLLAGHILLIRIFERSNLSLVRIDKKTPLFKSMIGFVIGFSWLVACITILYFLDQISLNTNFSLSATALFAYFIIVTMNAAMQELLVHGYLFTLLQRNFTVLTALVTTSLFFLVLHPGAISAGLLASINVLGAGLIFGLITIKYDSLWAAIIAHAAWNYFGAVWFGLIPIENYPSMELLTVSNTGLLIDHQSGLESSPVVTISIVGLLVILARRSSVVNPKTN